MVIQLSPEGRCIMDPESVDKEKANRFGGPDMIPRLPTLILLACFGAHGCGKPEATESATVRGIVTFQGRSTTGGVIVFTPDREKGCTGKQHSAIIGNGGEYSLDASISAGWYKISISEPVEWYGSDWERLFPAALRRPDQSGLERQLKPGDNVFDFPIELTE